MNRHLNYDIRGSFSARRPVRLCLRIPDGTEEEVVDRILVLILSYSVRSNGL